MKRIIKALMIMLAIATTLSLGGCTDEGELILLTVTFNNATEYDIEGFGLQYMGENTRRKNPMEYPAEEDSSLKSGEERDFTFSISKNDLPDKWGVNMGIAGIEGMCYSQGTITLSDVKGYEITFYAIGDNGSLYFLFTDVMTPATSPSPAVSTIDITAEYFYYDGDENDDSVWFYSDGTM